jgi:hypothetical protein
MQISIKNSMKKLVLFAIVAFSLSSCKKETDFIYEVNDVQVSKEKIGKGIPKTTVEFISIAYSDLVGSTISQNDLSRVTLLYLAFGDKRLIEDLLIKNIVNSPVVNIPTEEVMRNDITSFINSTYLKLFNREPNEVELYSLRKQISENTNITPKLVYYAMMTSDEYRYY